MPRSLVAREAILNALREQLEPVKYVNAMWEGGAASFKRVDQWSDMDLQIDVADDRVADTFVAMEQALTRLSPIDLKYG